MARKLNRRERRERMEADERVQDKNRELSKLAEHKYYKYFPINITGIKFIDDIINLRRKKHLHEDMVRDGVEEPEPYVEPKYTLSRFACINAIMTWGLHLLLKLPRFSDPGWGFPLEELAKIGCDPRESPEYKANPTWYQVSLLLYSLFIMVPVLAFPAYVFIEYSEVVFEALGANTIIQIIVIFVTMFAGFAIGFSVLNIINKLFHISLGYYVSIFSFLIGVVLILIWFILYVLAKLFSSNVYV